MKNIFNIAVNRCNDRIDCYHVEMKNQLKEVYNIMGDTDMYDPVPYETYGENPFLKMELMHSYLLKEQLQEEQ